ncbi:MAG: hypothetical protein GY861_22410 [bacterium]|nr:hypothetical protein [bacterium]
MEFILDTDKTMYTEEEKIELEKLGMNLIQKLPEWDSQEPYYIINKESPGKVELKTLEELANFINENGPVIVHKKFDWNVWSYTNEFVLELCNSN